MGLIIKGTIPRVPPFFLWLKVFHWCPVCRWFVFRDFTGWSGASWRMWISRHVSWWMLTICQHLPCMEYIHCGENKWLATPKRWLSKGWWQTNTWEKKTAIYFLGGINSRQSLSRQMSNVTLAVWIFFVECVEGALIIDIVSQMLNVWHIYLHLPPKLPKCR